MEHIQKTDLYKIGVIIVTLFVLLLLMAFPVPVTAQTNAQGISGKVLDKNGEALIGVGISVRGTDKGTITDMDGHFYLPEVEKDAPLVFSYIGYKKQEINIGSETFLTVIMQDDTQLLDELIVVGYGTAKRSDISGAVSSVKIDDLPATASASISTMLRGRAAGLQITQNSATPGGSLNFMIRGSVARTSPLIVIDGVPQVKFADPGSGTVYAGAKKEGELIGVNPGDIETIDILKDASAAAIYGSDAAGGVILITTKKGKAGKADITYNGSVAIQYLSDLPNFMNAKDFMIEQNKVFDELGRSAEKKHSQDKIDNFVGNGTNWMDEVTRLGVVNNHNLSVTSGSETLQVLTSLSYFNHDGVAKNNSMNRITGRLNVDQKLNNRLTTGIYTTYAQVKYKDVPLGDNRQEKSALIYSAMTFNPTVPVYDANGKFSNNPDHDIYPNPVSLLDITDQTQNNNFFASAYLEAKPVKDLSIRLTAGIDRKEVEFNQYIPTTTKTGYSLDGQASKSESKDWMLMTSLIANYNKNFVKRHNLGLMAGVEYKKQYWDGMGITASDFPYDGALMNNLGSSEQEKPDIRSYKGSKEMASFISRLNYSLDNKYSATFNLRVDGSSNFSPKHQYGVFPGGSIGWRLSEENFFREKADWFNNMKLRFGIGQTGNAGSLTGIVPYYSIWNNAYAFDGSMSNAAVLANIGNENLKWETLTDYNLGIDFGFIRNRISGTIDLYQRRCKDVIMQKNLMSYNEVKTIDYNSAVQYQSRGIDFNISTVNFDLKNFGWTTNINLSCYVTRTIKRDPDFIPAIWQPYVETWGNEYKYLSGGLIQSQEIVPHMGAAGPGSIKYLDLNGYVLDENGEKKRDKEGRYIYSGSPDGILDEADLYKIGNSTPIPFSINNTFRYKNWDLNIYLYGSLRGLKVNDIYTQSVGGLRDITSGLNALELIKERWSFANRGGTMPGVNNVESGVRIDDGNFFYESAWYMRLDNISFGYNIPPKKINKFCSFIHAYVAVRNLYVFTPYKGMDPETGNGIGAYPNQRSFAVGLDIKF
jgi:TonB-linked SusC/RagA family outer membrane protein